jgi:hypothetical protein
MIFLHKSLAVLHASTREDLLEGNVQYCWSPHLGIMFL